jgi:hypothetical protein
MNCQNPRLKNRNGRSNAIRMVSVLSTMFFKEGCNGCRISSTIKEGKAGSWYNPDTITGNFFAYGKREKKSGRKAEGIYSLSNSKEWPHSLFSIYGMVSLPS